MGCNGSPFRCCFLLIFLHLVGGKNWGKMPILQIWQSNLVVLGFEFNGEEQHECRSIFVSTMRVKSTTQHLIKPLQTTYHIPITFSYKITLIILHIISKKKKNTVDVGLTSLHLWVSITSFDVGLRVSPRSPNLLRGAQVEVKIVIPNTNKE